MFKNLSSLLLALVILNGGLIHSSRATVELVGQSMVSASMGLANGDPLIAGVVNMGFYSITPTRSVFENYTQASSFLTSFTSLASGSLGIPGFPSVFSISHQIPYIEGDIPGSNIYQNQQIYLLIGNSSSISTSSQIGVYTNPNWLIPVNTESPIPDTKTFDISEVNLSGILFGSFAASQGAYPSDGIIDEYRLAVIPEPSTISMMFMGLASVLAFRRKTLAKLGKCD